MNFWKRLVGKRREALPLGLADLAHPARRWIDIASVIADQRLELKLTEGRPAITANVSAVRDLVGALDMAVLEAPNDPDVLTARAAAKGLMGANTEAAEDLSQALRAEPHHIEASALLSYGDKWNNMLFLPSWSSDSHYVHPVLAEKANRGDILHCVRHKLQGALVLLLVGKGEEFAEAPTAYRWEVVCSETPHGPIAAHYALLKINGAVRRQECILVAPPQRLERSEPPPALLARLPAAKTCFIVVADSSGKVLHNLQYNLPTAVQSALKRVTQKLTESAGAGSAKMRQAAEWHMQNFNMDTLGISD
jgi:hypothetical protein